MLKQNRRRVCGLLAASCMAACGSLARAQEYVITNDTFIDSGSPGTYNPATGTTNDPGTIVNGQDIYSYGADGKVKAVTSSYSSSYPYVSATHVLFQLPASFWSAIGSQDVTSAIVSYYPFNDSLSVPDQHDNMELHPLQHSFTIGNGTQSPLVPSTDGGATWDSYDGAVADAWTNPGGDFDTTNYVLASVTDSTLPPSKAGIPFSWNITSLINNPITRAELENNGALIKVINEGIFPNNPPPPGGENDFVSFYSANYETAMGTTNPEFLPNIMVSLPSQWLSTGGGDFNTAGNWNNGVPSGAGAEADFLSAITANSTVTTNTAITVGIINFNSTSSYTLADAGNGTGSLTLLAGTGSTATMTVQNGSQIISLPTTFASNATLSIASGASLNLSGPVSINGGVTVQESPGSGSLKVGSLSIASGGTLDLTNNTLIVNYGSGSDPVATIRGYLISGFNASGTKWAGTGITSSTAAADSTQFALGYADGGNPTDRANVGSSLSAGEIEIKYTVAGDVNLSGAVDLSDLVIIASDFGMSGADWAEGDMNYDGNVDLSDLVIVASNFGASLASKPPGEFSYSFAAEWQLALAEAHGTDVSIPEPAGLAIIGAAGLFLGRRRRAAV